MDDLKFLAIFLVAPLIFFAWSSDFDFSGAEFHGYREVPTIQWAEPNDPNALTIEEWTKQGGGSYDADYGRYD